jgi:hypothetical protein
VVHERVHKLSAVVDILQSALAVVVNRSSSICCASSMLINITHFNTVFVAICYTFLYAL